MRKDLNEKQIIDDYISGKSLKQISDSVKTAPLTVRKLLARNGVEIRPKHLSNRTHKKCHTLNLDYFKCINSKDKAYWLGVIVSDGTIQKDGYKTALTSKDKDLILKFKHAIESGHPISKIASFDKRTKKTYTRYMIQINSKEFTSYIINLGITSKKSYVCNFPKIEEKYYLHFLRGLFDGDGSVTLKNKNNVRMSFTATREIINFIQKFFKEKYNIEPHPIYITSENMNVCRTHYFEDAKKLLSLLYENSIEDNRLNRKYKIYKKL